MFYVAVILMSVLATGSTQVSEESCRISDEVLQDLLKRGVSPAEVGQVHLTNGNALCFNETSQPSCCSATMENVFEDQVEESLRQKLVQLMTDFEDRIQNHVDEFDHFVLFGIHSERRDVVLRLQKTFGILLSGTLDEVNTMYLNMAEYFSEGAITGEEIVVSFLESLYTQLTQQLFGRSSRRYIGCTLTIMNKTHPNFFTEKLYSLKYAVVRPLLDFRAYRRSFRSIRKVFRRLKHMGITDECKKNIIRSTKCPFCRGLGQNLPPCPLLCTRVFEHCTHFSDGVFFGSLIGYINAMSPIAQRLGLLDVLRVPDVIGNAVLQFHSFWERRRLQVEESCGESLYNSPEVDVPITEDQDDNPPSSGYRTFAKTLRTMNVLNNITQTILNHDYFCETSSPFSSPCWNGSHVSTLTVDHGSLIVASDAPPEILKEAKVLKRLAAKLRKVSTESRGSVASREDKNDPSLPVISEKGQCPHHWHRFGTSCYLMTSAMTFTSALQECTNAADNGDLVSIQSVEENEFITSFVEREKAWIGAWKTLDGLLYWLNGDEWTFDAMISQSQSYNSSCFATNDIGPGIWSPSNCGKLKIAVCEVSLVK